MSGSSVTTRTTNAISMCLVTEQKVARITAEDMVVWKILMKGLSSVFFEFQWEFNVLYHTEIKIKDSLHGLEFYNNAAYVYYNCMDKVDLVQIAEGFHAITSEDVADESMCDLTRRIKVKCLIPAGAEVFEDATGLIVSNQMMLIE